MPLMMPGLCIMTGTYIVVKTLEIGRHWNLVQVFETMMNSIKTSNHLCRKKGFFMKKHLIKHPKKLRIVSKLLSLL